MKCLTANADLLGKENEHSGCLDGHRGRAERGGLERDLTRGQACTDAHDIFLFVGEKIYPPRVGNAL